MMVRYECRPKCGKVVEDMGAYNVAVRYLRKNHDEKMSLLVKQYYYGRSAMRELKDYLREKGIDFN